MRDIIINNWDELHSAVFENVWDPAIMRYRNNRVYRGMADCAWGLTPSLNRACPQDISLEKMEKNDDSISDFAFVKEFIAKVFAKTLQCEKGETEPCGECRSCKQIDSKNHPDVIWVTHEKPNSIGVDDIRAQVNNDIGIKAYYGPKKIYIINFRRKINIH